MYSIVCCWTALQSASSVATSLLTRVWLSSWQRSTRNRTKLLESRLWRPWRQTTTSYWRPSPFPRVSFIHRRLSTEIKIPAKKKRSRRRRNGISHCYKILRCRICLFSYHGDNSIDSTHCGYSRRDDQAELAWLAWLNTNTIYPPT